MVPKPAVEILQLVCEGLEARNIEYMISGSVAFGSYVTARFTRDFDIVINLKEEDLDSFLEIFAHDFYLNREAILVEVKRKGMFNIISDKTGYKLDFVVKKNDTYRTTEFERKIRRRVFTFEAWVVSAEDLLLSKLIWIQELESEIQKNDITDLIDEAEINLEYVNGWIKKLNLKTYNLL